MLRFVGKIGIDIKHWLVDTGLERVERKYSSKQRVECVERKYSSKQRVECVEHQFPCYLRGLFPWSRCGITPNVQGCLAVS
jgi:hypothetical protein